MNAFCYTVWCKDPIWSKNIGTLFAFLSKPSGGHCKFHCARKKKSTRYREFIGKKKKDII